MKLKYISWIPAATLMVIIFGFSSKPAASSNESSMAVVTDIVTIYENVTGNQLTVDKRTRTEETLNHYVRKGAHFSEYALLALTIAFHLSVLGRKEERMFLITVALSCFYAGTDEFHQLFIPGRSGQIRDVLLDTAGAACAAFVFALCRKLLRKK